MIRLSIKKTLVQLLRFLLLFVIIIHKINALPNTDPILLQAGVNYSNTVPHFLYYEDNTTALGVDDILRLSANEEIVFDRFPYRVLRFGLSLSTFWLLADVTNSGEEPGHWKVATTLRNARLLNVYLVKGNIVERLLHTDGSQVFNDRSFKHRFLHADLELEAAESTKLLIQYSNTNNTIFALEFLTDKTIVQRDKEAIFDHSFAAGVFLFLILFNSFLGVALRKIQYLYYGLMHVVAFYASNIHDGFAYQYVLYDLTTSQERSLTTLTGLLFAVFALQFGVMFLNIKYVSPRLLRFCKYYTGILIILILVYPFLDVRYVQFLYPVNTVVTLFVLIFAGFLSYRHRRFFSLLFILSWVLLIFFGFPYHSELVSYFSPTVTYSSKIALGFLLEALFIGFALAYEFYSTAKHQSRVLQERINGANEMVGIEREKVFALKSIQMKSQQLATISHDLIQPVSSMRMAVVSLENKASIDLFRGEVNTILDAAERMIRGLINFSRRDYDNEIESISLNILFIDLMDKHYEKVMKKGLIFSCQPCSVVLDTSPVILKKIIDGLIVNAVNSTRKGRVVLGVRRRKNAMSIQVIDTGVGMSPSTLSKVREALQSKNITNDSILVRVKLFIVKTFCDQMGYRMDIDSVMGKGSVLSVTIPLLSDK